MTLTFVSTIPSSSLDAGSEGNVAISDDYFYIYANGSWRRSSISDIEPAHFPRYSLTNGALICDNAHLYVFGDENWNSIALIPMTVGEKSHRIASTMKPLASFQVVTTDQTPSYGSVSYDSEAVYIAAGNIWKKFYVVSWT